MNIVHLVQNHIESMEAYIAETDAEYTLFVNDDDDKSLVRLKGARDIARLHAEAARTIMAAEEWEILRAPLLPSRTVRGVEDTDLGDPGGGLGGTETDPVPTAPPIRPHAPTGEKEE